MEILRKLRWVLYPAVFILVFLFGAYCTFPNNVVREMAEATLTNAAFSYGPRGRGLPEVSFKDASLWRLSGVQLDALKVEWPAKNNSLPLSLQFESVNARLGIFSLLAGNKSITSLLKLYGGDLEANVKLQQKIGLSDLHLEAKKIDLGKMNFVEAWLGAPLQGLFQLSTDMKAKSDMTKDGAGLLKFSIDNLNFGPGLVNLPAGGFVSSLTVPNIKLGKLNGDFTLDKGQLESKTLSLSGGDVESEIKLKASLGKNPSLTRLEGNGWFSLKREFINSNETLKMLFDLIPELKAAQNGDGKVGLSIRGSLANPSMRLETYRPEQAHNTKASSKKPEP